MANKKYVKKKILMALQGGGAHGAFSWGVLDRLLEIEELYIEGLCGTSAGAMNASIAAYGSMLNGKQGARDLLDQFWGRISDLGEMSLVQPTWLDNMIHPGEMYFSPGYHMLSMMTEMMSPYQFNPTDFNPLRNILLELIDFEKLRQCQDTDLYVCATNVKTCKAKIFHTEEITIDALMASACLPDMFKAVEIDGEHYWDGGFMGNPPIFPLIDGSKCEDIMLVKINPVKIDKVPTTAKEIQDRINEISFNTSMMWEMRIFHFKDKLVRGGFDLGGKLRKVNFHAISADDALGHLHSSSKFNTTKPFLQYLKKMGRKYADKWIEQHYDMIGVDSSCDVETVFM